MDFVRNSIDRDREKLTLACASRESQKEDVRVGSETRAINEFSPTPLDLHAKPPLTKPSRL